MARIWIDDTLNQVEKIQPEGFAETLTITFRPALPSKVMAYEDSQSGANGDQLVMNLYKFILDHLVAWDLTDMQDRPAPLKAESLCHLHEAYIWSIEKVIRLSSRKVADVKKG